MKYEIYMEERNYGSVVVEAKSKDEAKDKALDAYYDKKVSWKDIPELDVNDICCLDDDQGGNTNGIY